MITRALVWLSSVGLLAVVMAGSTARAQTSDLKVFSIAYCELTQKYGQFCHTQEDTADDNAMSQCREYGGTDCQVVATALEGNCVALAIGPDGAHGVGEGRDLIAAVSDAVLKCGKTGCVARVSRCSRRTCHQH